METDQTPETQNMDDLGELDLDGLELSDEGNEAPPEGSEEVDFFPESKLGDNEDLKRVHGEMKAALTRKFQEASRVRKEAEGVLKEYGAVSQKAQIFDQLLADPRVMEVIQVIAQEGASPRENKSTARATGGEGINVEEVVTRALAPLVQQVNLMSAKLAISELGERHPDWKKSEPKVAEYIRTNPSLSPEQAYKLVLADRVIAVQKSRKKVAPSTTEMPSVDRGGPDLENLGTFDSIEAAGAAVAKKMGIRLD